MASQQPHALSRLALGFLVILTLAGQILEAERAPHAPAITMALREARVIAVDPGGSADAAGLRKGDRILRVGDDPVPRSGRALPLLRHLTAGEPVDLQIARESRRITVPFVPPPVAQMEILWRLTLAVIGIVTVCIGILVYFKKPRGLTVIFAGICFGMGYLIHPPYVPAIGWLLEASEGILDALTFLIPPLFVHLFLLFPLRHPWVERHRHRVVLLYLPSMLLLALALALRFWPDATLTWPPLRSVPQIGAGLLWLLGFGAALVLFIRSYRRASTETAQRQVRVILWGTILGTLPLALMLLLRQLWPGLQFPADRLAVVFTVLIPLSFGYAIVRHGVFDATLIVRRSLALSALSALLVLTYFATSLLLRALFLREGSNVALWISLASMLAVALLFFPAQHQVRKLMNRALGGEHPELRSLLYEFGRAIRGVLGRDRLARTITDYLAEALEAERVAFYEPQADGCLAATYLYGLPPVRMARYRLSPSLSYRLARLTQPTERGDLETELPFGYIASDDLAALEAAETELIVPLRTGDGLVALVLVGRPTLGGQFNAEDRRLAELIASEGGIALENARLHAQAQEERRLREEVDVARDLQERLLPADMPQVESLEISGFSIPCHGVGGDYYDCFRTPWGEILLAIGDASGKGVPGAILMANLQGLVKTEGRRNRPPSQIVERINQRLCEMRKPERYVTFCLARIDPLTGVLAYSNAGHPGLLLVRSGGAIEELSRGGLPLGIRPQASYDGGEVTLRSGDLLALYTDGITERRCGEEEFGPERLSELLRRERRASARALQEIVLAAVRAFAPGPLDDDTTLLLVKVL